MVFRPRAIPIRARGSLRLKWGTIINWLIYTEHARTEYVRTPIRHAPLCPVWGQLSDISPFAEARAGATHICDHIWGTCFFFAEGFFAEVFVFLAVFCVCGLLRMLASRCELLCFEAPASGNLRNGFYFTANLGSRRVYICPLIITLTHVYVWGDKQRTYRG